MQTPTIIKEEEGWRQVDSYIESFLASPDHALSEALKLSKEHSLPEHQVSPTQGKLLHILALSIGARRALEVGTLGGYSSIWIARALLSLPSPSSSQPPSSSSSTATPALKTDSTALKPQLITIEREERYADIAQLNIATAGLSEVVEVRRGEGLDSLEVLAEEIKNKDAEPFDFIFIDADKANNKHYLRASVEHLSRIGSLIVLDNVVREGRILSEELAAQDGSTRGVRETFELLRNYERDGLIVATALQTVGTKGWDGFAVARVMKITSGG